MTADSWLWSTTDYDHDHEEGADHESIEMALLLIPFCLLIGNIVRHICREFHIPFPYTVILLVVGIILGIIEKYEGSDSSNILSKSIDAVKHLSPHLLLGAFVAPLVFESAFGADYHVISREFGQSLLLAGPGVLINCFLTAIFCKYIWQYSWTWPQSILFGSIVSATDPVAVVSLLRDLGASKRLATLIEGESLLNDGSAFVVFEIAFQFVIGSSPTASQVIGQFFQLTFGGIFLGIIFGIFAVIWLRLVFNDERIEIVITLISCYLVFYVCENELHASGVLGCVFLGLYLSKYKSAISPEVEESLHHFWSVLAYIINTLIFIFGGIIIVLGVFEDEHTTGYTKGWQDFGWNILLYIFLHIIRAITILILWYPLSHMGYGISIKEGIILIFAGLRGVIALALALIIKLEPIEADDSMLYKDLVLFHVCFTVFWTLLINASMMKPIVSYLELNKTSNEAQLILDDAMQHLRKATKNKMQGMKGDPNYSGAHWEQVVATLPVYVDKDKNTKKNQNKDQNRCCYYCKNPNQPKSIKDEIKKKNQNSTYERLGLDKYPELFDESKSNVKAIKGRYRESKLQSDRFGMDKFTTRSNDFAQVAAINIETDEQKQIIKIQDSNNDDDDGDNDDNKKVATAIPMTELKDNGSGSDGDGDGEFDDNNDINLDDVKDNQTPLIKDKSMPRHNDFSLRYKNIGSITNTPRSQSSDSIQNKNKLNQLSPLMRARSNFVVNQNQYDLLGDTAYISNTLSLMIQKSEEFVIKKENKNKIKLACKQQIKHRILLVLKRECDKAHEEGIMSLDSHLILDNAISSALDNDNLNELGKHILKQFELRHSVTKYLYKCHKNAITQYLLLNKLSISIEIGLIFITSFEVLKCKIDCIPSIASSPILLDVLDSLKQQVSIVRDQWIGIHDLYPEIYNAIQTRHAVQMLIHYEAADIEEIFERGLLDEIEYRKMTQILMKAQHHLYFQSFYYVTGLHGSSIDKKQTLISTIFMTKLNHSNNDIYNAKIGKLYNGYKSHIHCKNDIIIKKSKQNHNGIYILVSGTASVLLSTNTTNGTNDDELYLTKGAIIGGYEYLTSSEYLNTIIAKTCCELYFISDELLKYILKNENIAKIFLWKQIAAYIILSQYHKNNTSFFAFYNKTDINIMCQQSTYKEFNDNNQKNRNIILTDMALLLDGTASYNDGNKIHPFKPPYILLPMMIKYNMSDNSKLLIFDHDPSQLRKTPMLLRKRKSINLARSC